MSDSDSEPDFAVTTADLDMRDLFSNSEILLEVECQRTCANEEWTFYREIVIGSFVVFVYFARRLNRGWQQGSRRYSSAPDSGDRYTVSIYEHGRHIDAATDKRFSKCNPSWNQPEMKWHSRSFSRGQLGDILRDLQSITQREEYAKRNSHPKNGMAASRRSSMAPCASGVFGLFSDPFDFQQAFGITRHAPLQ